MKTVFSNAMTAHVWAQQNQATGRSGSMSFQNETLYSYRTPIARIIDAPNGARVVLVTSNTYSVTTSGKHMPCVWRAIQHLQSYSVPSLYADHKINMDHYISEYQTALTKLSRARDKSEWRIAALDRIGVAAREYANTFQLAFNDDFFKVNFPRPTAEELAEVRARASKIAAKKAQATREANRKKEEAFLDAMNRFMAGETDAMVWNWYYYANTEQQAAVNAKALEYWREGKTINLGYFQHKNTIALRIKDDAIQTSAGAEFPVEHGKRAFKVIMDCIANKSLWQKNGRTIHLGSFEIDKIDPSGDVWAGCHHVEYREISTIASQLGLIAA